MKKPTKKELDHLRSMKASFQEDAESLGLLNDYLFVRLFDTYESQLAMMSEYMANIAEQGVVITVPAGKNLIKPAANPAAVEYNKMVTSSSKLANQLDTMIERARKNQKPKEDDEL